MTFNEILTGFDDILYTWLLIYMLAGAGIYFTVRSGFVQIRLLKEAFNCMFEKRPGDKGVGCLHIPLFYYFKSYSILKVCS